MLTTARVLQRKAVKVAQRHFHALIMGPPGGGKGTLSKRIEVDFNFEVNISLCVYLLL